MKKAVRLAAISFGALVLGISLVHATPDATSYLWLQAGKYSTDNIVSIGPATTSLSWSIAYSDSYTYPPNGYPLTWHATSGVSTTLGAGGRVTSSAHVDVSNTAQACATASGAIHYTVALGQMAAVPFTPSTIPVTFSAQGMGSVVGYGRLGISASLDNMTGFPSGLFSINYEGGAHQAQFQQTVTVNLQSNTEYRVSLTANALAANFAYPIGSPPGAPDAAYSDAYAWVDPVFGFDQAAFNALYGINSFVLSDYYQFNYSPNMSTVPIPGAVWLLGTGLIGLIGLRRKFKE
jgi:hypothetical protein